ncbi:MAG: ParB/RepB/Spo0J family partition protein [Candidatus Riflebacteria bacterium]|nr:ParB/RepB/Spo0J family partition protein [Candidatus Riflebacteria bacterium]MBR4570596.1 ParB/RepB/Spo0J family partition protein [Candidatus Riflebacteria bacterium]
MNNLNCLSNSADIETENKVGNSQETQIDFKMLPIDRVFPNKNQPRKLFDKSTLEELAQSIRENGVLQPILVRQIGNNYQIVSGERRYRASKLAGMKSIPAVVRRLSEEKTMLAALIENIQRQDLNPVEEARTLRDIILNYGLTHDQLAEKVGKSRSALTNRLRLLQLPPEVQLMVADGRISAGHAKMLAGLKDNETVRFWAKKIISEQLSVYETEKQIGQSKAEEKVTFKKKLKASGTSDLHIRALEDTLQELWGAKVRIRQGKSKGRIEIEFYNTEDLERVVDSMVSNKF